MSKTYVVDLSEYQGNDVDFGKIEDEGFGGVIIKSSGSASKGWFYHDPTFIRNSYELMNTRLIKGAYHYLTWQHPGAQAAMFTELLELAGPASEWAPVLDIEDSTLDAIAVNKFFSVWHQLNPHRKLTVYSRKTFWDAKLGASILLQDTPLINSHWVPAEFRNMSSNGKPLPEDNPLFRVQWKYASQQVKAVKDEWWSVNYGGRLVADLTQFTDNAWVAGKRMDCSVFRGNKDELGMVFGVNY